MEKDKQQQAVELTSEQLQEVSGGGGYFPTAKPIVTGTDATRFQISPTLADQGDIVFYNDGAE